MIINFKKYDEYENGDYVVLKEFKSFYYHIVKIIEYEFVYTRVKSFNLKTGEDSDFWIKPEMIDRKATPEEIEEIKIIKNALKYNL